jgi:diamine N-acetyltransferase
MKIGLSLRPWIAHSDSVLAIEVTDDQKRFVADLTVAEFLADEEDHPTFASYAICHGDDVVGLVCYGREVDHESWRWWIPLLVIDRHHQGKGYGRAATEAVIGRIRTEAPDCRAVGLSCKPDNVVAERLYRSLGFIPAGANPQGGVDMWLALEPLRGSG